MVGQNLQTVLHFLQCGLC